MSWESPAIIPSPHPCDKLFHQEGLLVDLLLVSDVLGCSRPGDADAKLQSSFPLNLLNASHVFCQVPVALGKIAKG